MHVRTFKWLAALCAVVGCVLLISTARAQSLTPRVAVAGQASRAVQHAKRLGSVDAAQTFSLALTLPLRNRTELKGLLRGLYDPADPRFHHFLTSSEFAAEFGPTQADYNSVIDFAKANGLTVTHTYSNRTVLDVAGPASAVEAAFEVSLSRYAAKDGHVFHAPDVAPTVPSDLGGVITAVVGLDDAVVPHPRYVRADPLDFKRSLVGTGPAGGMAPADTRNAYDLTSVSQTGFGQTVGLFEMDGYTESDIQTYATQFNLPSSVSQLTNVLIDGATGTPSGDGGEVEVTLDIDMILTVAPLANIIVYEGPNTSQGDIDLYTTMATDDACQQLSTSWGDTEIDLVGTGIQDSEETEFTQMVAQGQTLFSASGDTGAFAYDYDGDFALNLSVSDPASDNIIDVGGTDLTLNGQGGPYVSETSWNEPFGFIYLGGDGGCGGVSMFWTLPSYQTGVITPPTLGSNTMRNVPDVSLYAAPDPGYDIEINMDGGWGSVGGTSAAAPLWAGFLSLVNEARGFGHGIGFASPAIYQVAQSPNYTTDFHDIADGSNNFYYPAVKGYDLSTGWGSFVGANLLADLTPSAVPGAPTLTAVAGDTMVSLTWPGVNGAAGFEVQRAKSASGPFSAIASTVTNSYVDSNVADGSTYYYEVASVNSMGTGSMSAAVSATPESAPAPTGLVAMSGNNSVTLSWTAAASAKTYNVYRGFVQTGEGAMPYATGITGTSFTDTGLTNGTSYFYTVAAVGNALSVQSAEANAIPIAQPKPAAGTKLNTSSPLANGLMLCAPLNEGTKTVTNLVTGSTATVNTSAGWTWSTGPDGVDLTATGAENPISFVASNAPSQAFTIFVIGDALDGSSFFSQGVSVGGWTATLGATGSAINDADYGTFGISDNFQGEFVHEAMTRSSFSGADDLYMNGTLIGQLGDGDPLVTTSPSSWAIGAAAIPPSANLIGSIEYVLVWNRPLAAAEIAEINANPYGILGAPVVQFTVSASAGTGGTISPSAPQTIAAGGSIPFTATPAPGYTVGVWSVDNVPVQTGGTQYTLSDIESNHTVSVTFTVGTSPGSGSTHVLWTNAGGTLSLWSYSTTSGAYTQNSYGPFGGWTAKAIADGPDGMTRVLWVSTSGAAAIWSVNDATGSYTQNAFGPYKGWSATGLTVGADNTTHVLWTNGAGTASIWNYNTGTGSYNQNTYGPFTTWNANAVADGTDGQTRVLWSNTAGNVSVWSLNNTTGAFTQNAYGPFGGWSATALSVDANSTTHLLWVSTSGNASLWNLNNSSGAYTQNSYGPYASWTPISLADQSDGTTVVLWDNTGGAASIWDVNTSTGAFTQNAYGPATGWTASAVSAYP
ncbi:MAG: protease pro-enzyme activation domain-containing protein [Capsulimonadaceae bacterium]